MKREDPPGETGEIQIDHRFLDSLLWTVSMIRVLRTQGLSGVPSDARVVDLPDSILVFIMCGEIPVPPLCRPYGRSVRGDERTTGSFDVLLLLS